MTRAQPVEPKVEQAPIVKGSFPSVGEGGGRAGRRAWDQGGAGERVVVRRVRRVAPKVRTGTECSTTDYP